MLVRAEAESVAERNSSNVFHDDLAVVNQPFYFHEFAQDIAANGMQFLSEADPKSMTLWNPEPEIAAEFQSLATDILSREQYLDFITCRRFRSTLICRDGIKLDRKPSAVSVRQFYISSPLRAESDQPELSKPTPEWFISAKGPKVQVNHPLTKSALIYLQKIWARCVDFDELIRRADGMLSPEAGTKSGNDDVDRTAGFLRDLFLAGLVKFHSFQPRSVAKAGEFPKISAFAAWQVRRGCATVTNLSGINLEPPDDRVKQLMMLLDGTRDRAALADGLRQSIASTNGDNAEFERNLAEMIEISLSKLADAGLLEA